MKELNIKTETRIEVSVKQKKQIEHELVGNIIPHDGHTIWRINKKTLEIEKAKFSNTEYKFGEKQKKEIIIVDEYAYVSALNKKNALKKFHKGKNGSKDVNETPLSISIF